MKSINKKVIGIAKAAAGVLAAAFLLLWQTHENEETKETVQQVGQVKPPIIEETDTVTDEEFEAEKDLSVNFDSLHEMNPDIVAWIEVEGTDISYPVLQSASDEPEDYYLTHDVNRNESKHGAIYAEKE